VALALLAAEPAAGDVGVDGVDPPVGAPGEPVELSIGCGACLAVSVAQGPRHPPSAIPVSLVPVARTPKPPSAPVAGPPRDRPFVFLGRAKPLFQMGELRRMREIPQYRLRFRIPRVEPGAYAFVIYCDNCYRGARGSLIVDPTRYLLHVRPDSPVASAATGAGEGLWIAGGAALVLLTGGAVFLRHRRNERA
jgi:hypothetical protein